MNNIFNHIKRIGCDDEFEPQRTPEMKATHAGVGTLEKIQALADRVANGLPLWHEADNDDFGRSVAKGP